MSAKEALIFDVNGGMRVSEAAALHKVARSCAYKWVARYQEFGLVGLEESSRRPERSPDRTEQALVDELIALKTKHLSYGPAKLVPMLDQRYDEHVMAVSTAGQILARHGLVTKRRPRQRTAGRIEHSPYEIAGAGDSMTADYKGAVSDGAMESCAIRDRGRSVQPVCVGHRCDAVDAYAVGKERLRTSLSRVWSASTADH